MNDPQTGSELSITAEIKLYYDLHVPDDAASPAPLLIAVHGYGAHKRYMMREARLVAPADFVVASIQGPYPHFRSTSEGYKIGFGWLTDFKPEESVALHHSFVNSLIGGLVEGGIVNGTRVFLYGFSQACALNFRYAFTYPTLLRGIVGVCGGIPGDLDINRSYTPFRADTLYLYGDNDEFYSQERFIGFDTKLKGMLPNYRSIHYKAKHEITESMRSDIRLFLGDHASK